MQATGVVTDLGVVHRRPTGTGDVNWLVKFDATMFQGLAKTSGKVHIAGQASPKCEK